MKADLSRLAEAVRQSRTELNERVQERRSALLNYVGRRYSREAPRRPINLLELAVTTYTRLLAAGQPRVRLHTDLLLYRSRVRRLETAVNKAIERLNLRRVIEEVVTDAMFGLGVLKTGIATAVLDDKKRRRVWNQVYVQPIEFPNFVLDMSADRIENCQFLGDIYRVPRHRLIGHPEFSQQAVRKLEVVEPWEVWSGSIPGTEPDRTIGSQYYQPARYLYDMVELWDFWLPEEGRIVTTDRDVNVVLRDEEWRGPEGGPYIWLGFEWVPGNILPLSLADVLKDLHEIANNLFVKSAEQALRQKRVLGAALHAQETAQRIADARDGEIIRMESPSAVQEYTFGGVPMDAVGFVGLIRSWFSYFGGNIDALSGLRSSAETLGQEQIMLSNASRRFAAMQDHLREFVTRVARSLVWYRWNDRKTVDYWIERPKNKGIEPYTISFSGADVSEVPFEAIQVEIDPFSLEDRPPARRGQELIQLLAQVFIPLSPVLQQQGIVLDYRQLASLLSEYFDLPELSEIVKVQPVGIDIRQAAPYNAVNIPRAAAAKPGNNGLAPFEEFERQAMRRLGGMAGGGETSILGQ